MPQNDQNRTIALDLLDQTYEALRGANFAILPSLAALLEEALIKGADGLGEGDLRVIRQKADRNAVMLLAAQRGIRAARRRVAEIRTASSGLVTYDRSGKRAEVSDARTLAQRF
jgi:hypothetical protein